MHLEPVQGKFNPLKLGPHIFLNIDVGCHFSSFFTRFSLQALILSIVSKTISENWKKNKGWPTKSTIFLPDYVIRRIPPLWEKYQQTWNMYNWGLFRFIYFFKKNAPPQEMNPQFGNTLICGSLFNGNYVDRSTQSTTIMNLIHALLLAKILQLCAPKKPS